MGLDYCMNKFAKFVSHNCLTFVPKINRMLTELLILAMWTFLTSDLTITLVRSISDSADHVDHSSVTQRDRHIPG